MTRFMLNALAEKLAPAGSFTPLAGRLLYHQLRTVEALRDCPVVINTYNTGTGKTQASLLRLIELNGQRKNVLFIAPTNALIEQHTTDICQFVQEQQLAYIVKAARASDITTLQEQVESVEDVLLRRGELLYRLMRNPREFDDRIPYGHAMVMVTNPDIFYYALYFQYAAHDQRNLAIEFIKRFDYIVIDESHYYSNKQFTSFLFAIALFDQFGYFSHEDYQRRVCMLSATPRDSVMQYLRALLGERFKLISPSNEPEESAGYESVPVLVPLEVAVYTGSLSDWLSAEVHTLLDWVRQEGLDGAVISSSLARINEAYTILRRYLDETMLGRITGPEPDAARQIAGDRKLILATPTVDIGYNFAKSDPKERQNIDFVVCDARFRDELVQRIGRAGRVLKKGLTNIPSRAVLLLSEDAANALTELDGKTLERSEFANFLTTVDALPAKHRLDGYVRTYAVQELFWPIYKLGQMMTDTGHQELDVLYTRLCDAFAPGFQSQKKQKAYFKRYEERRRWLDAAQKNPHQPPNKTEVEMADWIEWNDPMGGKPEPTSLLPHVALNWRKSHQRQEIIAFVKSQVALTQALFSFRDAFQGPTAAIYDPNRYFSSEPVNTYDIFHLLSNYHLSDPMSAAEFSKQVGHDTPDADFYCRIVKPRERPVSIELSVNTSLSRKMFEDRWSCLPVAMSGIQIQLRERGGEVITGGVHYTLAQALADKSVVMLIVPPSLTGQARTKFAGTEIWPRRLTINFEDSGELVEDYWIFLGTSAFEAHAELKHAFWLRQKAQRDQAIIV